MSQHSRAIVIVVLITLFTHAPLFARPFYNVDEATYSVIADELLRGGHLYRDAVDHKPPLIYWTYAAVYAVSGSYRIHFLHAVCLLWILGTAWILAGMAARACGPSAGFASALLYGTFSAASLPKWFLSANCELWMA